MNEVSRSSFIPKQTRTPVSAQVHKKGRFNALAFVAAILLIVSLVIAAGTFIFKDFYIAKQLVAEKEALAEERGRFNESDIARVREIDRRISAAFVVLNTHLAPTRLLDTLELATKKSVQFTSFSFEQLPSSDVFMSLGGETDDFKTVALQAQSFSEERLMGNVLFSGVNTFDKESEDGEDVSESLVGFTVSGNIDAVHLLFEGVVEEAPLDGAETAAALNASDGPEETSVSIDLTSPPNSSE